MIRPLSILFLVAAAGVLLLAWPLSGAANSPAQPSAVERRLSGTEQPREGCLFQNGFNICDFGEAKLRDGYLRYAELIGEPLSSFDAQCQTFRFARLCFKAGNPDGWKIEFANLG